MFLYGSTAIELTYEDHICIRDWENYIYFDKLPHELGYTSEPCYEDHETLKELKRLSRERQEHDRKKQEAKQGIKQRAEQFFTSSH